MAGRGGRYSIESVRARVRGHGFVHRHPLVLWVLRSAWHGVDLLRPRKNRSYFHGLLFDLSGAQYCTEGMTFQIVCDQFPRSYRSRLYFDIYEAPERALSHRWIPPDASVLELGGCVGVVSCVVNRMLDRPEDHVVVEANPTLIDVLRENRDVNGCSFKIENCIVSTAPESEFYISDVMTANRKDSGMGKRIRVDTKTLPALERQYQVRFDTLILDIEGGELEFLTENADRLDDVNLIILELHRNILSVDQVSTCTSILEGAGLKRLDSMAETEVWARQPR